MRATLTYIGGAIVVPRSRPVRGYHDRQKCRLPGYGGSYEKVVAHRAGIDLIGRAVALPTKSRIRERHA